MESDEAVLRPPRPGIRRLVPGHRPLRPSATGPAGRRICTSSRMTWSALAPARTLDVACGTGFLTRHLRGEITALDQSERMLEIAAERVPEAMLVSGDALALPFADGSFDRLFTGHFYGHLRGRRPRGVPRRGASRRERAGDRRLRAAARPRARGVAGASPQRRLRATRSTSASSSPTRSPASSAAAPCCTPAGGS